MKPSPTSTDEIRDKILAMMEARGISQRQVALGAGISTTTMSRFYRGKGAILTDKATGIINFLRGVPVARKSAAGGEDQ